MRRTALPTTLRSRRLRTTFFFSFCLGAISNFPPFYLVAFASCRRWSSSDLAGTSVLFGVLAANGGPLRWRRPR